LHVASVGELTAERCAIDRGADTVELLVHLGAVLTHALADDVQRGLEIGERATGDTREYGKDVVARELVAPRTRGDSPQLIYGSGTGVSQAAIAAMSGLVPMMFMTRVRL
jgi:hypothetical protein